MDFNYTEVKETTLFWMANRMLKENFLKKHGVFYLSFSKYEKKKNTFFSFCSTEELKQEIKKRNNGSIKKSPVCKNNRICQTSQLITYDTLFISEPEEEEEEKEILHRKENGYRSFLSINIANKNEKYAFNLTSKINQKDSRDIFFMEKEKINLFFNLIKYEFDQIIEKI